MIRIPSSSLSDECLIEGLPPPQWVESVEETNATTETKKALHPSPMSIFEQKERSNAHLSQQALNVPKTQKSNGWYNPFASFYGWALQAIYGSDVKPEECGLTESDYKKIQLFSKEVRTALAALDALIAEDDEVKESFDELLMMAQRHKELLHKKTIIQQGESLKKAHKEVSEIRERIKKETNEFLDKVSRNGTLNKLASLATPAVGLISAWSLDFGPELNIIAKPVIFGLSALAGANIAMEDPLGEHLTNILNTSLAAGISLTQSAGLLLAGASAAGRIAQSWNKYSVNSFNGLMGVEDNKRRLAEEKYNDIGSKASSEASKHFKGISSLSEMLAENLELIKRLWNR